MTAPDRDAVFALVRALSGTCLSGRTILAESPGVFAASDTLPAFTDDGDLLARIEAAGPGAGA